MFLVGSTALTEAGEEMLQEVIPAVLDHPGAVQIVVGESPPMKTGRWSSSVLLSVERAMAVREFLVVAGVPPAKVSMSAYGESASVDHRQRIEIVAR